MYLPRFDPWEMYLALYCIYILSSLFHYKELKMALINLDLHCHIILTVKVLGGFCELLGWKSSIQSGNTDSALCSLL